MINCIGMRIASRLLPRLASNHGCATFAGGLLQAILIRGLETTDKGELGLAFSALGSAERCHLLARGAYSRCIQNHFENKGIDGAFKR